MKSRGAPPPPGAAPAVSREIVNIVKKKLSAPSSAPPENMRSVIRPVKHERHDDHEEDGDGVDDVDVGEIEEKINGKKYFSNSSQLDRSRTSSETDKKRSMDRNSWDNDDRPDERQFQQPRRAPTRRIQNENDDEDDDEGSYDEYESDHSGQRRGGRRNNRQMMDSLSKGNRDRDEYPPSLYPPRSEAKNSDRDRDDRRPLTSGSKGATPRPIKPATYNFQPLLKATYRELRSFVLSPCDPGVTTKCYIERTRGGGNMFAPIYSLCADLEDGTGRELLVCRKVLQSMSSHYVFSLKTEDLYRKRDQRSRLFLGKLRSTSSSEYILYDNGMVRSTSDRDADNTNNNYHNDDDSVEKEGKGDEVSLFRKELAVIHFNTKKRPAPLGIRGSEICIPTKRHGGDLGSDRKAEDKDPKSTHSGQSLQNPFQIIRSEGKQNQLYAKKCFIMHERTSRYDPLSSCLVDFKGRANIASVKNFQLVQSYPVDSDGSKSQEIDGDKDYILQVGKTTVECFNMDYRHPLSMLQAFSIAIARFDAKINW